MDEKIQRQCLLDGTKEPWGMREFGIETPDGHRIMFGQKLGQKKAT
jgi:hypothetical protein